MCLHTFHCLSLNKNQTLLRKGVPFLTWHDLLLLETSRPKATALLSIAKADFDFCVVFWRSKEKENNLLRVCSLPNAQIEYLAGISFEDLLRQTCCPLGSHPKLQRFSPRRSFRSQPTFRLLSFLWDRRGELEKTYTWMRNSRKKREVVRRYSEIQRQRAPGMDLSYTPGFSYLILSQKSNGCGVKQKVQWWLLFPSYRNEG